MDLSCESSEFSDSSCSLKDEEAKKKIRRKINRRQMDEDLEEARQNFRKVLSLTNDGIEGIMRVAEETSHPRAYEVLAQMLKTSAEVTKELAAIHRQRMELEYLEENPTGANMVSTPELGGSMNITNNNLFVGSTSELQKMLDQLKTGMSSGAEDADRGA
jgi:hypothetical protein